MSFSGLNFTSVDGAVNGQKLGLADVTLKQIFQKKKK
jgi:hypothetical protein